MRSGRCEWGWRVCVLGRHGSMRKRVCVRRWLREHANMLTLYNMLTLSPHAANLTVEPPSCCCWAAGQAGGDGGGGGRRGRRGRRRQQLHAGAGHAAAARLGRQELPGEGRRRLWQGRGADARSLSASQPSRCCVLHRAPPSLPRLPRPPPFPLPACPTLLALAARLPGSTGAGQGVRGGAAAGVQPRRAVHAPRGAGGRQRCPGQAGRHQAQGG
jgi:hypothetical protein